MLTTQLMATLLALVVPEWSADYKAVLTEAQQDDRRMLVLFYDDTSENAAKELDKLPEIRRRLANFHLYRQSVDTDEGRKMACKFRAVQTPYLVVTNQRATHIASRHHLDSRCRNLSGVLDRYLSMPIRLMQRVVPAMPHRRFSGRSCAT